MERLNNAAQRVFSEANAMWMELGLNEETRAAKLDGIVSTVERVLEEQLEHERAGRDKVKRSLAVQAQSIVDVCKELGVSTPQLDICGMPLLEGHAVVTKCLAGLEKRKAELEHALFAMVDRLVELSEQLGDEPVAPRLVERSNLSAEHTKQVRAALQRLERIHAQRVVQARKEATQVVALCKEMRESVPQQARDTLAAATDADVCVHAEAMESLHKVLLTCEQIHHDRKDLLEKLKHSICVHYTKLHLPEHELEVFLSSVQVLDLASVEKCQAELSRLFGIKRENAQRLLRLAYERVQTLWDELAYAPEQRVLPPQCVPFAEILESTAADEASPQQQKQQQQKLLDESALYRAQRALEAEEAKFERLVQEQKELEQQIREREGLVREREQFELEVCDPERFRRHGYNGVREDQQRKKYCEQLPRLEQLLIERLKAWARKRGRPFVYNGEDYLARLVQEHNDYQQQQQQQREKLRHKRTRSANEPAADTTAAACAQKRRARKSDVATPGRKRAPPREQIAEAPADREVPRTPHHPAAAAAVAAAAAGATPLTETPARRLGETMRKRARKMKQAMTPTAAGTTQTRLQSPAHNLVHRKHWGSRRLSKAQHTHAFTGAHHGRCWAGHRNIQENVPQGVFLSATPENGFGAGFVQ